MVMFCQYILASEKRYSDDDLDDSDFSATDLLLSGEENEELRDSDEDPSWTPLETVGAFVTSHLSILN